MDEKNYAETIRDLAVATRSEDLAGGKGNPYLALPPGCAIHDLEKLLEAPTRIKSVTNFIALESFCRYVNIFKNPDTRIVIGPGGNARAVIDAHGVEHPRWESHWADFIVTLSDRWKTWDAKNKGGMTQRQFAEFVEDNTVDFVAPSGSEMLDIAKTLHAEQNSNFKSGVRLENGDVSLTYEKTTVGKAGQRGDLEIPSVFQIQVPILEGELARLVDVRLKYDLVEGKLTFSFEIIRRTALLEEVRRSIFATIANETKIQPFLVV